jgi:hypothetical protein
MILSGEVSGKMNRVCCGAVKIFMGNKSSTLCTFLQNLVGFAIESIMDCRTRQDDFANFIAVKQ